MKIHFLPLLLAALLAPCNVSKASAAGKKKHSQPLTILHTNDTHSCIMPLNENLADTLLAGRGGFIRRLNMIEQERKADPDLLLLDSGDFSQGSSYYTLFHGDVETGLMNLMHYDAATIGNHEFDFGLENMARLFRQLEFPIVCANYDFTGTPVEGLVKPYIVLERKGMKIGIFGLSPEMEGMVAQDNFRGVKYLDPVETAASVASTLKEKENCDFVICLSHLGWWKDSDSGDAHIVSNTRNIDLVLGGHTHTYMQQMEYVDNLDHTPIPVEQNGKSGIFVGKLTVQ